jgi:CO/xanthine dehydrogenase Mo-binding subunit
MESYELIGKNIPRVDAEIKVTGSALYTADIILPNMLWGKLLRSPLPHAKILNIDTIKAERLVGVKAVITGKDTPFAYGLTHMDQRPLQYEKVRHVGDPVAAVAATDIDTAQEALSLIKVDYEELPAVFDPEQAMQPGAPIIHEGVIQNIAARPSYSGGDIEVALREADHIFEDRFETQRVAHVCGEPHCCVAVWDPSGKLTFYVSSQMPSLCRVVLAKIFNLPESKVRVITNHVGGGFGSKTISRFPIEFAAIILAKKTGRPVKFEHTREEEFIYSTFQNKFIINIKTGIKSDGTIVGRHFKVICEAGGYVSHGVNLSNVGGALQAALYSYKNYRYDSLVVYTNLPYGGAWRGVSNPVVHFAGETQLNMIAHRLSIDPLELRLRNAIKSGEKSAIGSHIGSCGLSECLESVAKKSEWEQKRKNPKPNRGLGIACGVHFTGVRFPGAPDADFAGAIIMVNDDGSVNLATSCVEIGSGTSTVLAQIAAEILRIEPQKINVIFGDTETCPMGWGSRASRNTAIGGMAVKLAAEDARKQILNAAAEKMGIPPDNVDMELDIKNGIVYIKRTPSHGMSISDVVKFNRYRKNGQAIMATAHWDAPSRGNITFAFSFSAKVVEVEVDPGTGQIRVLNVFAAQDLGKAINPLGAMCQIEGGVYMGLGLAMSEEILLDEIGRMRNDNFLDYRTLTSMDMPPVSSILVESNDPLGPFGAKGLAEMALFGVPEGLAAAVYDAAGVWIKELPITPEKVLLALKKKE